MTGHQDRPPKLSGLKVAREMLFTASRSTESSRPRARRLGHRPVAHGPAGVFVISSPDYVDHVLHDGADGYHKSIEYELLRTVLGLNLFTDEDESWRRHRMMLNPVMAKRHVEGHVRPDDRPDRDASSPSRGRPGRELEIEMARRDDRADPRRRRRGALRPPVRRPRAKACATVVTGGLRAGERATRILMVAAPPPRLVRARPPVLHHSPVPAAAARPRPVGDADGRRDRLGRDPRAPGQPDRADDLLNLLLSAEDEQGKLPPQARPRRGHDVHARRPRDDRQRARLDVVPARPQPRARETDARRDRRGRSAGGRPTVDDIPELPWTTACFQEAMRMYPPAWAIPRTAIREDDIDGHRIPKGATVIIPVHAIHHDERFWPDPETLRPDALPGREREGPPPLRLPAVRRRAADLHRHELRADGGDADHGDDEPAVRLRARPGHPGRARGDADPAPALRDQDDRPQAGRRSADGGSRRERRQDRAARGSSSPAPAAASAARRRCASLARARRSSASTSTATPRPTTAEMCRGEIARGVLVRLRRRRRGCRRRAGGGGRERAGRGRRRSSTTPASGSPGPFLDGALEDWDG